MVAVVLAAIVKWFMVAVLVGRHDSSCGFGWCCGGLIGRPSGCWCVAVVSVGLGWLWLVVRATGCSR